MGTKVAGRGSDSIAYAITTPVDSLTEADRLCDSWADLWIAIIERAFSDACTPNSQIRTSRSHPIHSPTYSERSCARRFFWSGEAGHMLSEIVNDAESYVRRCCNRIKEVQKADARPRPDLVRVA